jgi:hypothetical protein
MMSGRDAPLAWPSPAQLDTGRLVLGLLNKLSQTCTEMGTWNSAKRVRLIWRWHGPQSSLRLGRSERLSWADGSCSAK